MKITPIYGPNTYIFNVEHKGKNYSVTIWTKESGRFIDWEVVCKSDDVTRKTEDEIIEAIEKKWDSFSK